jgi:hypothetical protein
MLTKIYLVTNCYNDPNKVYIGKTKNCRKNQHKQTFGSQIIYTYIDEINSLDRNDWKPLESYWIEQFRQWGFEIMNKNKGGNGPEYLNNETKIKIGLGNKGIKKPGVSEKTKGHNGYHKEDTGYKIKTSKNKWFETNNHTWGEKISQSMIGNKNRLNTTQPQSQKDKVRQALSGVVRSEEVIQKMRTPRINKENFGKHRIGIKASDETIKKQRQSASNRQKPVLQYDLNGNFINEYQGVREAARFTGFYDSSITMCCKGRLKQTKGFIFKYKE